MANKNYKNKNNKNGGITNIFDKFNRNNSSYSIVSLSEVTEGAVEVWRTLPEIIKQDPSLASFRAEHERLHGE